MRFKNKWKLLLLLPITLGFILYSCIDEPTIAPVGSVHSVIKIANMTNNVDAINFTIDGNQKASSLAKGETTDYFDTDAGKLKFSVTNGAGEKIYEKTIEITTWERSTIVFAGDYSSDELLNTLSDFQVSEGEIYVSSKPVSDSLNIYFVHASNDVDTFKTLNYNISAMFVGSDTTYTSKYTGTELPLKFTGTYSVGNAAPGDYTFYFITDATPPDTVMTGPYSLAANFRYYLYLYGNPNNLQFTLKEVVPPPIGSRD